MTIKRGKRLDFTVADSIDIYSGPVGVLWEMLMGEQIHVGGAEQTRILADKAKIGKGTHVLDVCCALGGPARHLAKDYGCNVTGLDATAKMLDEATVRTAKEGLSSLVTYKLGSALDMPFKASTFDVVWGQDAWCYVNDKSRLLSEAFRVLKPHGTIAFTDWLQVGNMTEKEWSDLNSFMMFPYMETLAGYTQELKKLGFTVLEAEDLSRDFAQHCHLYYDMLTHKLKDSVIESYGPGLYQAASDGLQQWVQAADDQKVGRGRIIAQKN
ncbi:MAG: methyltransferase domain-containing protein [Dehalococcoidia bacterium]